MKVIGLIHRLFGSVTVCAGVLGYDTEVKEKALTNDILVV